MKTLDWIRKLFDHMEWADRRVLRGLERQSAAAREWEWFRHVLGTEEVWLARIQQRERLTPVWPDADLDCESQLSRNRTSYCSLLEELSEDDLDRSIEYENSDGVRFESCLGDILVHVALHGMHHRGQISTMLRDAGLEPIPDDYIAFVRGTAAATRPGGNNS